MAPLQPELAPRLDEVIFPSWLSFSNIVRAVFQLELFSWTCFFSSPVWQCSFHYSRAVFAQHPTTVHPWTFCKLGSWTVHSAYCHTLWFVLLFPNWNNQYQFCEEVYCGNTLQCRICHLRPSAKSTHPASGTTFIQIHFLYHLICKMIYKRENESAAWQVSYASSWYFLQ